MRVIIYLILFSLLGYGLLQLETVYPNNYVKIYAGNTLIELNLLGFILLTFFFVVALFISFAFIKHCLNSPFFLRQWRNKRNTKIAEQNFGAGYLSLIRGDWKKAQIQLLKKSQYSNISYVNHLGAAKAAQELGDLEKRDTYLNTATTLAPQHHFEIELTRARLYHDAGQHELCITILEALAKQGENNPQYTAMMLQSYEVSENFSAMEKWLTIAKKQRALPEHYLAQLQQKIHLHTLQAASNPQKIWQSLSKTQKQSDALQITYAKKLIASNQTPACEKFIIDTLKRYWSNPLMTIFATLTYSNPKKSWQKITHWIEAQPNNNQLHLAAANVLIQLDDNQQAQQYLLKTIDAKPSALAYKLMATSLERTQDTKKALEYYHLALQEKEINTLPVANTSV